MSVKEVKKEVKKEDRLAKILTLVLGIGLILALLALFARKAVGAVKLPIEILKRIILSRVVVFVGGRSAISVSKSVESVTPKNILAYQHKVYMVSPISITTAKRQVSVS
jgi:uncharacterized membrane protein